jgi:hypothetical protein
MENSLVVLHLKFVSDLRQVGDFLRVLLVPRYNWNIV